MPPRRQRAAQAACSPTLFSLPAEVLLRILAAVPPGDRLSHVALACKQLSALCTAPELLSELDVRIQGQHALAHTQALLRFLMRHGGHVCSLQLDISLPGDDDTDDFELDFDDGASLVAACVAACGAQRAQSAACGAQRAQSGGGLRQLSISAITPLLGTSCLPLLPALEELSVPGRSSSLLHRLGGAWRQHTALRALHLSGRLLCGAGSGPALPPSLTRLSIEGDWGDEDSQLDDQLDGRVLAGLPAVRCFELHDSAYASSSLAAISSLTALTRLVLSNVEACPPAHALAALAPGLRALEVRGSAGSADELSEAIQALTALESLALDFAMAHVAPAVPFSVMGLSQLLRLSLSYYAMPSAIASPWSVPMPCLPLSRLHWLALPLAVALAMEPLLAQASRLETLCLLLPPASTVMDSERWSAFWQLVITHPPLRSLLYEVPADSPTCSLQLLDALLQLQRRRPALHVRRLTAPDDRALHPPACWAELDAA